MTRFIATLFVTLWASFLFASSVNAQPDISNFVEVSIEGQTGFYVNYKDAKGKYEDVSFVGLVAQVVEDGLHPGNYIFSSFRVNCVDRTAIQGDSFGIVRGEKYEKKSEQKEWRKPGKDSPLEKTIYLVCKKKFGESI